MRQPSNQPIDDIEPPCTRITGRCPTIDLLQSDSHQFVPVYATPLRTLCDFIHHVQYHWFSIRMLNGPSVEFLLSSSPLVPTVMVTLLTTGSRKRRLSCRSSPRKTQAGGHGSEAEPRTGPGAPPVRRKNAAHIGPCDCRPWCGHGAGMAPARR